MDNLLQINNGKVKRSAIPHLPFDTFRLNFWRVRQKMATLSSFLPLKKKGSSKLLAVVRNEKLYVVSCEADPVSLSDWLGQ